MFRVYAIVLTVVATFAALMLAPAAQGYDHGVATPEAGHGEAMSMTGTAAAFMTIRNSGSEDDVLLGGKTDVANVVEVHEMADVDGVMEMRPLIDGLAIPAGGEATLRPGGYHIMLIGLAEDLSNGKTYDLTLHFRNAGDVTVPVTVRPRAEMAADATPAAPVTAGDITIRDPWSRPAPATGVGAGEMGTPEATPHA